MLSSVFLFTGENSYMLNQQLNERKTAFIEKYGADALLEYTSENRDSAQIKQSLYAGGLFITKKMLILYGVPKDTLESNTLSADLIDQFFEDFQKNSALLTPDTLLILVSYKPDKRTRAYKWFLENVQLKEFPPYKEIQLKNFIKEQLAPLTLTDAEISHFLLKVGTDMFRLANECKKLKAWLASQGKIQVSIADIDYYCFWLVEQDSFELFDQLFSNPSATVKILEKLQSESKARNEVQGLLLRGLKVYLTLLDFDARGINSAKEIIAETKLHPFVVNKNLKLLPLLREHRLFIQDFFKHLIELESDIKAGKKSDQFFRLSVKSQILSMKIKSTNV